ncbi:hypothetical protein [Rhodoferax mekongensis]|uniref:Uncharacterized protein n=1 Tax=Rhodoferax mekongensis TaxID=3068341 RepID=A0ABZ0AZ33_9BURK|nr:MULTISPECIES: hypothetical protein [unclassified Rhodoferax]MDT7514267.1 hypothetical protein [Rhodoferax sp. TBRC 17199]WNO04911.1 hypothetical protein RAN89_00330 [Rhodoferax sp. TBRC 17307]
MHDRPPNQAAGLMDFAVPQTPKLLAMVSHGDEQAELPLLLRVCAALVGFGYTVTVLDGSVLETPENPGLEQLLNFTLPAPTHDDAPGWSILPAGIGLQSLSAAHRHGGPGIGDCGSFFAHESIVIVYANAHSLTPLLRGSQVRPLLAMSAAKTSLLTTYLALKRLLLKAKVEPTIVNMVDTTRMERSSAASPTSLSDCAKYFLNYEVNPLHIPAPIGDERPSASIERLSLGLLETAMPLEAGWAYAPQRNRQSFSTAMPAGRH